MKDKILIKYLFYGLLMILAALISWNYPFMPTNETNDITAEAVRTIHKIALKPHSYLHPQARHEVREYLLKQFEGLGLNPLVFNHDSILTRTATYVSLSNIFVQIAPPASTDSTSYLLLIAHYDSTGIPSGLDSTAFSYGAADNGYGVGMIMGLLREALKYRAEWKHGLRILLTDLEEEHVAGMKMAVLHSPEMFNRVNFSINIEARGVKGPALLFETSPGNSKIMDLYTYGSYPYAYSLTSVIYQLMPNYTDFECIKDKIPGMNFAVIDNLNYYHTHLDRIESISTKSLDHYSRQLAPILTHYLRSDNYKDSMSLKSDKDDYFFVLPPWGLVRTSDIGWFLLNLLNIILFITISIAYYKQNRFRLKFFLKTQAICLGIVMATFLAFTFMAWCTSLIFRQPFHLLNTRYIPYDLELFLFIIIAWNAILFYVWLGKLKQPQTKRDWFWNILFLTNLFGVVLYLFIGENFFLLIPAMGGTIAFYSYEKKYFIPVYVISGIFILLIQTAFIKQLFLALTFGAIGIIGIISLVTLLPIGIMGWYFTNTVIKR